MPGVAAGTRIMTMRGELALEALAPDELLPAYFNGSRALAGSVPQAPEPIILIAPAALGPNMPRRALRVAASQPVLLGGLPVPAAALVNGVSIAYEPAAAPVTALNMQEPDALMAEGAWLAEPGAAPPPERHELEAALRPLLKQLQAPPPGKLRGFIDRIDGAIVEGWAQDETNTDLPQWLELSAGSEILGHALACHYRADLEAAGMGRGRAHFVFTAAQDFPRAALRVRRVADGAEISPVDGLI